MGFHFYNTFLNLFNISSLCFWWNNYFFNRFLFLNIIIIWLSYCVCNFISYKFTCFMDFFLEAVVTASRPVSNNWFLYFLANDKNPYPLTYFFVLGSISSHFYLLISNVKLTLPSMSNGLPFWSVNVIIISSNSVL